MHSELNPGPCLDGHSIKTWICICTERWIPTDLDQTLDLLTYLDQTLDLLTYLDQTLDLHSLDQTRDLHRSGPNPGSAKISFT